jgi:hypothetical protein
MKKFFLSLMALALIVTLSYAGLNDRFSPIELMDIQGAEKGQDIVTKTYTQTLTNKTLTAPTITSPTITGTTSIGAGSTLTSPRIGTSILDVNGGNLFTFSPMTTPVNYWNFINGSTGVIPTINMTGETNVGMSLNLKGAGTLNVQTQVATDDTIVIKPYVGGAAYFSGTITSVDLTTPAKVWTFPNLTGTVTLTTNKLSVFAATTSAELAGVISDETGTGAVVLANTPTLVTPALGAATGTSLALGGGTALATTNQTGTGNLVLVTSPTLVTPALGVATATSIALGGGTAITKIVAYAPTLTPAATAAAIQTVEQTFTVTGLTTADKVIVNGSVPTSLCPPVTFRVSVADTLAIGFTTLTAVACTPAAGVYNIIAIRN